MNEALFYERLEVFSTERREDILRNLRHHHEEYANLHEEFGQLYIKMSALLSGLDQTQRSLIDKFSQVYSTLIILESNQIYLQGQVDGMRIMKKLNEQKQ
jgi:hypothetical protein